jgi:hypothetical protein
MANKYLLLQDNCTTDIKEYTESILFCISLNIYNTEESLIKFVHLKDIYVLYLCFMFCSHILCDYSFEKINNFDFCFM